MELETASRISTSDGSHLRSVVHDPWIICRVQFPVAPVCHIKLRDQAIVMCRLGRQYDRSRISGMQLQAD